MQEPATSLQCGGSRHSRFPRPGARQTDSRAHITREDSNLDHVLGRLLLPPFAECKKWPRFLYSTCVGFLSGRVRGRVIWIYGRRGFQKNSQRGISKGLPLERAASSGHNLLVPARWLRRASSSQLAHALPERATPES